MHRAVNFAFVDQFKTAEIEASQYFGLGQGTVAAFGECEIPTLQDRDLRHYAAKQEIKKIGYHAHVGCEIAAELVPAFRDRLTLADKDPAVDEEFTDLDQIEVDAA